MKDKYQDKSYGVDKSRGEPYCNPLFMLTIKLYRIAFIYNTASYIIHAKYQVPDGVKINVERCPCVKWE